MIATPNYLVVYFSLSDTARNHKYLHNKTLLNPQMDMGVLVIYLLVGRMLVS